MNVGFKNKLYLIVTREWLAFDIGPKRFELRWLSAEDGRTIDLAFYSFRRTWQY